MHFTKLRLRWGTGSSDVLTLSLNQMNSISPYFVKAITGLEPPDINLAIAIKAEEGGVKQGDKADNREITILLGFQPEYASGQTVGDLRQKLYPMLRPKLGKAITITLLNDDESEVWTTSGHVKTMTPNIFTKDPEIQIVISCLSPYFDGDTYVHPDPASLGGKLTFVINNKGTAPSGFIINVTITAINGEFVLWNEDHSSWIIITFQFVLNDKITINTIAGQRSLTLLRNGVTTNLLQYLSPNSKWLQLDGGTNEIDAKTTGYAVTSFTHRARYWGI